jgi:hypothetical protein
MDSLVFQKAVVLTYRLFDIADEVDLEHARRLLVEGTKRLKLAREGSEYLQLPNPPLAVDVGRRVLSLSGGNVTVEVTARIFDHGAISIIIAVPVEPGTGLEQMVQRVDELGDSPEVDQLSMDVMDGLRGRLTDAFEDPHLWAQNESYTIVFAEQIEGDPSAAQLLDRRMDLARMILGEKNAPELSHGQLREVLQHQFSYTPRDLAVVDWNSAFVYEPSGSRDIPDVLEICNAQLLELRYYDDLLDAELARTYDEVARKRKSRISLFRSPYRELERRISATLLEMSEFIERVENSLKIIGDFYLAKVYEAALRRLRVTAWQMSVTRKQQMLAQLYQLLKGEVDVVRSQTMEFTIVLLIVIELVVALGSALGSVLRH